MESEEAKSGVERGGLVERRREEWRWLGRRRGGRRRGGRRRGECVEEAEGERARRGDWGWGLNRKLLLQVLRNAAGWCGG